ncbi:MAG TPA: STAS domain-containing protein [Solirubrobacteraceae bacterium]|jgi:anti-sigma B factor antagonist|nr:STAS domain-containing protein [Solirubrobacteraceae bacterium]
MSGHPPKPGSLQISSALVDGAVRVSLQGELDLASAPRMEDHFAAIDAQAPARVVVDLDGLEFIDSSGLRMLLLADARAREHGYEFVLLAGCESVQRVFEMTGALDILRFES